MSQSRHSSTPSPAPGGGAGEWAEGMPAYWLSLVQGEAVLLARFYFVLASTKPKAPATYDQRLIVRVGGTEKAVAAVVAFTLRYALSMGHKYTARSIQTVSERLVQAWELAGRPGAA